jgi:hypothetical protein
MYLAFWGKSWAHFVGTLNSQIHRCGCKIRELILVKCRIDYIITPVKILQSLDESVTDPDEKYGYVQRLTPSLDKMYNFTEEEVRLLMLYFVLNSYV